MQVAGVGARPRALRLSKTVETKPELIQSAKEAGLRYVSDDSPGISRIRAGKGFKYVGPDGKAIHDRPTLDRIQSLAIPPAWTDVWICPIERGHIQAVGRDDRGRKQYRYHARWREVRDETKFDRMIAFAKALPHIRRIAKRHLRLPGLPREKVLATIVRLLEKTLIRVGNDEYAKDNHSYGLTTIRDQHVKVNGSKIEFRFRGKSGIHHTIDLASPRLALIVKKCQDLPGQELFQYVDEEGNVVDVTSAEVNDYLREISGQDFTAKDFRTWAGTVLAAMALQEYEAFSSQRQAKQNVVRAIESVAEKLGNTPAVCRKCYVHPEILDSYLDGTLVEQVRKDAERKLARSSNALKPQEAAVLALLLGRLRRGRESQKRRGQAA